MSKASNEACNVSWGINVIGAIHKAQWSWNMLQKEFEGQSGSLLGLPISYDCVHDDRGQFVDSKNHIIKAICMISME